MKVVLAGGSGVLGRRIAADLYERGDEVVVLTRSFRDDLPYRQVIWDGKTAGSWAVELTGAAVINLAGELVDRRPTRANIELLTRSRVEPTRALAESAASLEQPPDLWLQASTLAIFGDAGEHLIDESSAPAEGPPQMAGVARAWETAAQDAPAARQVVLRMAIVLDRETQALDRLVRLTRWGLGGRVGTGRQWVSWLHIEDLLAIVRWVLDSTAANGIIHATSPHPVRNAELMSSLRRALGRPALPTPAPAVRLGAVMMDTDPALALTGRRCVPSRLLDAGHSFLYPHLAAGLDDLL